MKNAFLPACLLLRDSFHTWCLSHRASICHHHCFVALFLSSLLSHNRIMSLYLDYMLLLIQFASCLFTISWLSQNTLFQSLPACPPPLIQLIRSISRPDVTEITLLLLLLFFPLLLSWYFVALPLSPPTQICILCSCSCDDMHITCSSAYFFSSFSPYIMFICDNESSRTTDETHTSRSFFCASSSPFTCLRSPFYISSALTAHYLLTCHSCINCLLIICMRHNYLVV